MINLTKEEIGNTIALINSAPCTGAQAIVVALLIQKYQIALTSSEETSAVTPIPQDSNEHDKTEKGS